MIYFFLVTEIEYYLWLRLEFQLREDWIVVYLCYLGSDYSSILLSSLLVPHQFGIKANNDPPFKNQNPPLFSCLHCQHHHLRNAIAVAPPHHRNHCRSVYLCHPTQPPPLRFPSRCWYIFNTAFATTLPSEKPRRCTVTHNRRRALSYKDGTLTLLDPCLHLQQCG